MLRKLVSRALVVAGALPALAGAANAHHLMGGETPSSFVEGLLSGLGHPVIGPDHLAAVVAVGCLAALHGAGALLVVGYVTSMMVGVAFHLQGGTLPGAEILVALSVLALGAALVRREAIGRAAALALFVVTGLLHGYAFGESIFGAEPTPVFAYLAGLAGVQTALALAVMAGARAMFGAGGREPAAARLVGAAVFGIGLAVLMGQLVPAA
ncbi:MAG TPA: HupE/UreJ family protein [Xanthobacteraceae bacterium]|nr:HupE/UreJ family protein [Xanthobacteraceae bacterium]